MCLISKWRFPKKADRNIVCYKVLRQSSFGRWITPYKWTHVTLDNYLVAKKCKTFSILNPYDKGAGYIHAYFNEKYIHFNLPTERVFIAIIPKGTKYHISKNGEICAKKMFITNEQLD